MGRLLGARTILGGERDAAVSKAGVNPALLALALEEGDKKEIGR